ncbi:MAG: LysR family transcriptional regulator [Limnobacter sp.]|uniref:LysR family transcriptional regulator n=1 Tax=Limnobacter sp. TaxID=2003368 RepID=UPI0032ECDB80
MNLRSLDLNLLLVFDAVYNERSISKAAIRLHLSQPAVSNALARLRERFDDPLFERNSQGMLPTPRAKVLVEPIRRALDILERGLRSDEPFDYAHSDREFVIAVEDYGETIILPRFIDWLAKVAPQVRINIRPEPSGQLESELREGTVDLALDYFALPHSGYQSQCLMTESLLSLSRKDHPVISEQLNLDTYLKLRHIALTPRTRTTPMIDLALSKRGMKRTISLTVPHFQSMPVMVQTSDMICTMPRRMANLYADHFSLRVHAVPLRIPEFPVYLIWHDSLDEDTGHRWLRNHLIELSQRL